MKKKKIKAYRYFFYYLLVGCKYLFGLLPFGLGFSFGGTMGRAAFGLVRHEREKTLRHLRLAFGGEKSEEEIRRIGRAVFEHYGRMAAEFLLIDKIIARFDDFVNADGLENFDAGLKAGRGIVVTIAHFGNWEIMGGYAAFKGYPCTVVARKIYFEPYNRALVGLRDKLKMKTVYRDESVRRMLGALKANELLGLVVDQDVDSVEGVFVNFFGRPAFTPVAPVRFAMATGAALIPTFIIREGMRHRMIVEPPIEIVLTGNKEEDIRVNTQKWVEVQEKYVRRWPHLWVWNHERWKTQVKNSC